MLEHPIDIKTRDGAMNTFITHPDEGGPFPVVLFYMDAPKAIIDALQAQPRHPLTCGRPLRPADLPRDKLTHGT